MKPHKVKKGVTEDQLEIQKKKKGFLNKLQAVCDDQY